MKTLKEYNQQELQELTDTHNSLVKPRYRCEVKGFKALIGTYQFDMTDLYPGLEISSHETISGHAEIMDLDYA
jgi:hypothetical protein